MGKLEAGVQEYMAEQGQESKDQEDQDQVKAPSSEEQEKEVEDQALGAGHGSTPVPPIVTGHSLSEIADPSSTEAAEPHNP